MVLLVFSCKIFEARIKTHVQPPPHKEVPLIYLTRPLLSTHKILVRVLSYVIVLILTSPFTSNLFVGHDVPIPTFPPVLYIFVLVVVRVDQL
ncbi:MAG: hypothetical protein WCL02_05075 [bacterium]